MVGDVIGKYHPHGDAAVYDTMVRMAQPFSMRYALIDGQGNFGSVDGDAPAAMRYTEVRLSRLAHELLADIDKDTVDFAPNYDGSEREPVVLPAEGAEPAGQRRLGHRGGHGHQHPAAQPQRGDRRLRRADRRPGVVRRRPDAPSAGAGFPHRRHRLRHRRHPPRLPDGARAHVVRARVEIERDEHNGRERIVVLELPYQVNKARLQERIAELVREKKVEGITEIRDESDKHGMRVVLELRRGEVAEVVLNNLYQHTQLQTVFGVNMVALVDGQPRQLDLKSMLEAFLKHRREVVTRRTVFELRKARERAHVLEGLAVALASIDPVIELIKTSADVAEARSRLMARAWPPGVVREMLARAGAEASRPEGLAPTFGLGEDGYRLSEAQAQAILDLRLQRLTGLEQDKIVAEYGELLERIGELLRILREPGRLMEVIREELLALAEQFGDERRTRIETDHSELTLEDLIQDESVVVTLSHAGYAKCQPLDDYRLQRRGGRGKAATRMKEEDFVDRLFVANTHDTLLCFSSAGKVYWLKVYELPAAGRNARGKPIVNLLPLEEGERINALLAVREFDDERFVFMATASGTVKRTPLSHFARPRSTGIRAIDLRDGDRLIDVVLTDGRRELMLFSDAGKAIRFEESEVRPMGRTAAGVRGIALKPGQSVIALAVADRGEILTATENGYGKRTPLEAYPKQGRGGQGVVSIQVNARNGRVVGAVAVEDGDEVMLISDSGVLVRILADDVSSMGRNTQGVRLIRLAEGERLVQVARIPRLNGEAAD
ncbi:MAG: DNA gyrase subunit A [Gammaproteobacteria bacterium]|nr:MAG: DNA gyrase subunit A [Gammaproteobacteria bacterium]